MMRYLTLIEVLNLHRQIIEQSGGALGVRDLGALESALAQPRMTFGGEDLYPTLVDKAAAVGFSIIMTQSSSPFINSRIQSYLRFAASQQRDTERIEPFLATFNRYNDNPFLNYAIPDDNAVPSLGDVNALITAYEKRGRKPRLEYIASLAPAVEEVLISAGFTVEGRLPLMICAPGSEQLLPTPPGIELIVPTSDAQMLATVTVQNEAYGDSPPSLEDAARLRASIAAGGIAVLARVAATGEPVGAGVFSVPGNQTTEIAGIGVRVPFRRRGIAGALTTRLVREAFGAGVTTAFLMAAHEEEKRIYTRAGFSTIGEILHISLPPKL